MPRFIIIPEKDVLELPWYDNQGDAIEFAKSEARCDGEAMCVAAIKGTANAPVVAEYAKE